MNIIKLRIENYNDEIETLNFAAENYSRLIHAQAKKLLESVILNEM